MKQYINEALSNLDNMIEVDAVANPVTAQLKKDIKKKYDAFKDMTETDDNYLGAKKQPVPKKVEVPKIDLDESLFEDIAQTPDVEMPSISDLTKVKGVDEDVSIFVDEDNDVYYIVDETNQTILDGGFESDEEAMDLYIEYMGNESLTEMVSESSFKDPSRIRIKAGGPKSYSKQRITDYLLEIINSCQFKPEILNQSDDEIIITVPGRQDWVDKLKAIDAESTESNIVTSIDESLFKESLKEDYSEDELEQAINVVKKYYHNNLHSFLESFVFNCPIADGGEIIKELADYISDDDYYDESLKEGRQNNIDDYIRKLHKSHPALDTADEMIEYLEDNDEIKELEDMFMTDVIGAIEEYFEDLDESLKKSRVQHSINEKREKVIQTPEERAEEGDLWTTIYNELSGDASLIKPSLGSRHSLYGREASNPYTKYDEILPTETGMRIYGESEDQFDFAKQVADDYNLYYWVEENDNNFDNDPNRQYYIDIDID